jgi:hypothetical protein
MLLAVPNPLRRPAAAARALCVGRTLLAAGLLVAPVPATRLLGLDTGTARRVGWLTRMLAGRDAALAVGGLLAARRGGDPGAWLLGGAAADAVDAVVLAQALRSGRLRGALPVIVTTGAAGAAAAGMATVAGLRRAR